MAIPAIISIALKALGGLIKKGAKKIVEKGAEKAVEQGAQQAVQSGIKGVVQKGVQTAAQAVSGDGIKLGKLGDIVSKVKGKNIINAVKNVATGDLYKNREITQAMHNLTPIQDLTPKNKFVDKAANALNKTLFSDTFGGDVLRRTMAGMAKDAVFTGSDVGQPERSFGSILGNNLLGAVANSAQDRMQQQFDFQEDLKKMMNEFNPADVVDKEYKGSALQDIDAFKNYIIDIGANKRGMQKGKYSSSEMMDIQNRFSQLQRKFAQYATDNKAYRDQYSEYQKSPDKYDANDFRLRSEYYVKTGRIPEGGVLTPAEVDPEIFFRNLEVTNKDRWETTQQEPWVKRSPLTEDKKKALAGTYFYTNPGLQKYVLRNKLPQWLNQYGNDKSLMNTFVDPNGNFDQMKFAEFMTAHEYGNMIEPDKPDYNQREIFLNRQKDQAEQDRSRAEDKQKQLGYQAVSSYPYGNNSSGPALVFDKNRTENISLSNLESITGTKLQGAADEAVPVNFEYIDNKGRVNVTASVKDNAGNPVKRMFVIPANKAKGLVEGFYPGAWENASKSGVFKQEVPKSPVIYNRDMEDKIGLFMEKNGIKNRDEAISILRQKGIL